MPHATANSDEFQLYPRIVPEGWSGELVVDGDYEHTRFRPDTEYTFQLQSTFFNAVGPRRKQPVVGTVRVAGDGALHIPFAPDVGGEWLLTVDSEEVRSRLLPCRLGLFVQSAELAGLRPYLGELHCHSTGSDGTQEPAYVPIRGRSYGLDFLALTDHRNFGSAVAMKERIGASLGRRMVLMTGEEMHPEIDDISPEEGEGLHCHYYHYVAIGQSESVRDLYLADPAAREQEVAAIMAEVEDRGPVADLDLRGYAEGVWKVRTARRLGATTIFCHPYWGGKPINLDLASIEQSLHDQEAHAVEAHSSADRSSYMANRLIELAGEGIRWPLVGVSDGHNWGAATEFTFCTLVLAEEQTEEAILSAVRNGRSVACRLGQPDQFLGPFDLIGMATFYCNTIVPLKRRYTALQAELAFSRLRGGTFDQGVIDGLDGELAQLESRLWADR